MPDKRSKMKMKTKKIQKTGTALVDPTKRYDYIGNLEYASEEPMPSLNHDKSKKSKKLKKSGNRN